MKKNGFDNIQISLRTKKSPILSLKIAFSFLIFAFFIIMYVHIITNGIGPGDESFYLSIPYRLFQGDGLIVDEWHISQFNSVLLYCPLAIYIKATGSTDGIVLFFRILYCISIFFTAGFALFSLNNLGRKKYKTIKKRRIFYCFSLFAIIVFLSYIPATIPSMSYYAISIMGLIDLVCLLFCFDKHSLLRSITAGLVFGIMVFAQPGCVIPGLFYLIYTIIAAINSKFAKNKKSVKNKTEEYKFRMTALLVSISFGLAIFIILCCKNGFVNICTSIPNLFGDPDHNLFSGDGSIFNLPILYASAFYMYGTNNIYALVILTLLSAILYKFRDRTRPVFLLVFAAILISIYISAWRYVKSNDDISMLITRHSIPLYFSGPFLLLISPKVDKTFLKMWLTSFCFSVIFSISSNIILCSGGLVAGMVSMLILGNMINDIAENEEKPLFKRAAVALLIISASVSVCFELQYFIYQEQNPTCENILSLSAPEKTDTVIESGPHKGIKTSERIAKQYDYLLKDIQTINDLSNKNEHLLVAGLQPWLYLASDIKCSAFSSWLSLDHMQRLVAWWKLHPEQRPDYIYYSYVNIYTWNIFPLRNRQDEFLELFDQYFDYETDYGYLGIILKVNDAKFLDSEEKIE